MNVPCVGGNCDLFRSSKGFHRVPLHLSKGRHLHTTPPAYLLPVCWVFLQEREGRGTAAAEKMKFHAATIMVLMALPSSQGKKNTSRFEVTFGIVDGADRMRTYVSSLLTLHLSATIIHMHIDR